MAGKVSVKSPKPLVTFTVDEERAVGSLPLPSAIDSDPDPGHCTQPESQQDLLTSTVRQKTLFPVA